MRFQQYLDASFYQFFLRGKVPEEIHIFLTETLVRSIPFRAKDLLTPLYFFENVSTQFEINFQVQI